MRYGPGWHHVVLGAVLALVAANPGGGPVAADEGEFTFVAFTDPHIPSYGFSIGMPLTKGNMLAMHNQQRLQQFVGECLAMRPGPAFVVNLGDSVDVGWTPLLQLYAELMRPLVDAGIPIYTVIGNHDIDYAAIARQDLAETLDRLGPAVIGRHGTRYSFDYDGTHIVVLNNAAMCGCIRLNPADLAWLEEDLQRVDRDSQVIVFLHAYMTGEDTYRLVEILQEFRFPLIFRGHAHGERIGRWGNVPMIITGALYGGRPESGSYRVVRVSPDRVTVATRDFAEPSVTLGPETSIEAPVRGPSLKIVAPAPGAVVHGTVDLQVQIDPVVPGQLRYEIPTVQNWSALAGEGGEWQTEVVAPEIPGRYVLAVEFADEKGAVTWSHRPFRVTAGGVQEIWSKYLGSAIQAAPANWRNLVVVPTREAGVYAMNFWDGEVVWHQDTPQGEVLGRIAVDGNAVYYGVGWTVCARDAATGRVLWETRLGGSIVAGPTAANGRLYVPAGESALHCLSTGDGSILWTYSTDLPIIMAPTATDDRVFFGAMDGYVRALDAATGREAWRRQVSALEDRYHTAAYGPILIVGNSAIVRKRPATRDEHNLQAFDAVTGEPLWSRRIVGGLSGRMAASPQGDSIYVSCTTDDGPGVHSLCPHNGSVQWTAPTGVSMHAGVASGGELIVRDANSVCCVDAATGETKWVYRASTGPQGWLYGPSAMTFEDGLAIVGTMDGYVFALQ